MTRSDYPDPASHPDDSGDAARSGDQTSRDGVDTGALVRPGETNASLRPADKNASLRPADKNASLRPADKNASLRPADKNASLRPADKNASLRLDKWLWFARFFKTRSLAAQQVAAGHVRMNGTRVTKPAQSVRSGDTLTFSQGRVVRVVRIIDLPVRRGPAPEARASYDDLSPPAPPTPAELGAPEPVPGRVSRKERRAGRLSRHGPLD